MIFPFPWHCVHCWRVDFLPVPLQSVQVGFDCLNDFFVACDLKFQSAFPEPLHFGHVADVSTDPVPPHLEQLDAPFPWQTGQTFSMMMTGCDRPTNHSPASAIINMMVRKYLIFVIHFFCGYYTGKKVEYAKRENLKS